MTAPEVLFDSNKKETATSLVERVNKPSLRLAFVGLSAVVEAEAALVL